VRATLLGLLKEVRKRSHETETMINEEIVKIIDFR
jgi:hypothetical protein